MATHSCILANGALVDTRLTAGNLLLNWSEFAASGLVLYHLNEATGTAVADSSGNGNNATLSAANWFSGTPWLGASAMGASATLTPGAVPALGTASWTMEGLLYVASNPGDNTRVTYSDATGPSSQRVYLTVRYVATTGPRLEWNLRDNAGHTSAFSFYAYPGCVGAWTHWALVCDGNTMRFYVNGVQRISLDITGWTWSAWTGRTWGTGVYNTGLDELRDSATAVYPNGTTFYPNRYPTSGTWTEASGEAEANSLPGVLTVELAGALPTGTSLKAKMLSTTGGDTGWQTMTGAGTTYTYDFTGQAGANWYAAVQLFSGGTLNANTPEADVISFAYEPAETTVYGVGSMSAEGVASLAAIGHVALTAAGSMSAEGIGTTVAVVRTLSAQPTPAARYYPQFNHTRSRYSVQSWRVSEGRCLPWLTASPPADFITRGIWHGILSEFDHISDAGFNTAVCPTQASLSQEVPALVAAATTQSLKVVPILQATPQVADVEAYDSDAAVAGWYVYDEPNDDTDWDTKLTTFMGYKTAWAATKPLMAGCSQVSYDEYRDRFQAWLGESEIALHDNYPYRFDLWPRALSFDSPTGIAANLPIAQAIAEAQAKEHWLITQAYGQTGATEEACQPPRDFLRAQTYFALISGATGYAHFAMDSAYMRDSDLYGIALDPPLDYGEGGLVISAAQRAEAVLLWRDAATLNAEVAARDAYWLSRSSSLDLRVDYIPTQWCWSDDPIRYGCRGAGPYWLTIVNIEAFAHTVRVTLPFTPSSISRDFGPVHTQTGPTFTLTMPAWSTFGALITE